MKLSSKVSTFFILFFFTPCWILAAPQLNIEAPVHNFGSVYQGLAVKHTFTLKNSGSELLEIQRVVPACGCTVSELAKDKLAPGESTELLVDFDTRGMSGAKIKTVRLYTNDPQHLTSLLTLKGDVVPEILIQPARIHFGDVVRKDSEASGGKLDEYWEKRVRVSVRQNSDAKIEELTTRSSWIEVETVSATAKSVEAIVRLRKDIEQGEFRDRIVVAVKGADQRTANIPLYASVRSPIQVKPEVVAFGIVKGAQAEQLSSKQTREVKLQSKDRLRLVSLSSQSPHIGVRSDDEGKVGRQFTIEVELDEETLKKDLRSAVKIVVEDVATEIERELLVSVTAVLPPAFLK